MFDFDNEELNQDELQEGAELTEDVDGAEEEEVEFNESAATVEGDELIFDLFKESGLLSEYQTSIVRVDKKTKINRLTAQAAYIIAREQNDPLFRKLAALNEKRWQLKRKIEKKYAQKGKARARSILTSKGITGGSTLIASHEIPDKDPNAKAE